MDITETLAERSQTHGNFEQGAEVFAPLFEILADNKDHLSKAQLYAVNMVMSKLVRILKGNANEQDHWQDIIGYCTLALNSMSDKAQPVNPYINNPYAKGVIINDPINDPDLDLPPTCYKATPENLRKFAYIGADEEREIAMALNKIGRNPPLRNG